MNLPTEDALARVRAGAAFLDEKLGTTWRDKIDLLNLNMANGSYRLDVVGSCGCLLAQISAAEDGVYGSYQDLAGRLLPSAYGPTAAQYGFYVLSQAPNEEGVMPHYRDLTEAWTTILTETSDADAHAS